MGWLAPKLFLLLTANPVSVMLASTGQNGDFSKLGGKHDGCSGNRS